MTMNGSAGGTCSQRKGLTSWPRYPGSPGSPPVIFWKYSYPQLVVKENLDMVLRLTDQHSLPHPGGRQSLGFSVAAAPLVSSLPGETLGLASQI